MYYYSITDVLPGPKMVCLQQDPRLVFYLALSWVLKKLNMFIIPGPYMGKTFIIQYSAVPWVILPGLCTKYSYVVLSGP